MNYIKIYTYNYIHTAFVTPLRIAVVRSSEDERCGTLPKPPFKAIAMLFNELTFFSCCKELTLILGLIDAVVLATVADIPDVFFSLFLIEVTAAEVTTETDSPTVEVLIVFRLVLDNDLTNAKEFIAETDVDVAADTDVGILSTLGLATVAFFNVDILGLPEEPCFGEFVPNGDLGLFDAVLCFGLL